MTIKQELKKKSSHPLLQRDRGFESQVARADNGNFIPKHQEHSKHHFLKTTLVDLLSVPTYTSASSKSAKIVMKIPKEINGVIHKVELVPLFTIATDVVLVDTDHMVYNGNFHQ